MTRPLMVLGLLLAGLATACGDLRAQRVVLPHATGGVEPGAGWTVLRQAEMDAAERSDDPEHEPGRSQLLAMIAELKNRQRVDEDLILHQPGAAEGQVRIVHAYSPDVAASSSELLSDKAVGEIRDALASMLEESGGKVTFVGHEQAGFLSVPGLAMRFDVATAPLTIRHEVYVWPAGDRLQYFECLSDAKDEGAATAITGVLRTFDGAFEPRSRISGILIGGLAGAVAGVVAALLRRRRQAGRILQGSGE